MQDCLTGIGALAFLLVFFWLPETWHGETPHAKACRERGKRFVMYWFNPLSSVALLRWPNVATIVSRHVVGRDAGKSLNLVAVVGGMLVVELVGRHDLYLCGHGITE
jgi:hypothetical protein